MVENFKTSSAHSITLSTPVWESRMKGEERDGNNVDVSLWDDAKDGATLETTDDFFEPN